MKTINKKDNPCKR